MNTCEPVPLAATHAYILFGISEYKISFELHRGVRQGDCLSPLIFNIASEPLAIGLRMHPNIEGLPAGSSESLISLYADDVLVTLTNPEMGIPHHLKICGLIWQNIWL